MALGVQQPLAQVDTAGRGPGRREAWWLAGLILLAVVTRAPLVGKSWGESDGARYLLGLIEWLRHGRGAPMVYARVLSPGYYALAAAVVQISRWSPAEVLDGFSLGAAMVSAPLVYILGRRLTSPAVALGGAVLFLLAPGYWWLGIEPHPQGVSFLCLLAAVVLLLGAPRTARALAAGVLLTAGLLLKNDLVLLLPAVVVLGWGRGNAVRAGGACVAAGVGFLAIRPWLLGVSAGHAQALTDAAVREFWSWPHGAALVKQVLPMLTAPGMAVGAVTLLGVGLGLGDAGWRRRWLWPLCAWAGPGTVFWFLVRGDNTRHMIELWLLPLWAGLDAVSSVWPAACGPRRATALVLGLLAIDFLLPPASSNMTLYPSGNVPASQRDVAVKTGLLQAWAEAAPGPDAPCLLGNYTLPYAELEAALRNPGMHFVDQGRAAALTDGTSTVRFSEINSGAQYVSAAAECHPAWSFEYTTAGARLRFMGSELP